MKCLHMRPTHSDAARREPTPRPRAMRDGDGCRLGCATVALNPTRCGGGDHAACAVLQNASAGADRRPLDRNRRLHGPGHFRPNSCCAAVSVPGGGGDSTSAGSLGPSARPHRPHIRAVLRLCAAIPTSFARRRYRHDGPLCRPLGPSSLSCATKGRGADCAAESLGGFSRSVAPHRGICRFRSPRA